MDPIREKILEEFKKSNSKRREEMAKKYGFSSPELLLANLVEGVYGIAGEPKGREKLLEEEMERKTEEKNEEKKGENKEEEATDVVIAFDTTGSMNDYIAAVRKHVRELIPEMFNNVPNLMMKIIAFGDYCDMTSKYVFGKAYQESNFTNDQNHLIKFVDTAKSTSGGDGDEFYELVIKKITEETPWRTGKKLVILIADYTPHPIGYNYKIGNDYYVQSNQIDWRVEARKAKDKGIQIDTFKIISSHTWYNELSEITNGVCLPFQTSHKTSEAVLASTYARTNSDMFMSAQSSAVTRGDTEMVGVYKSLASKLDETKKGE